MRIAVVGSGIAGLSAAYLLDEEHDVVLFESQQHVGGHTRTISLPGKYGPVRVDTGFVVFNETTYPLLLDFLRHLGIGWQDSDMSFSVSCDRTGLEYAGTSLNTLFAQRSNAVRASFLRMLFDIARFNRRASRLARTEAYDTPTLRAFISEGGYGSSFVDHYLLPMCAAIWSTSPEEMLDFPVGLLLRFLDNHHLLTTNGQYTWQVIQGGSDRYVNEVLNRLRGEVRVGRKVLGVTRPSGSPVRIRSRPTGGGSEGIEGFDEVVIATHADQALALLDDPSRKESEILGSFPFTVNEIVVHSDTRLLPRERRARASWNYHVLDPAPTAATVTYDMTRLQRLESAERILVTLNRPDAIDPNKVMDRFETQHPVLTVEGARAQTRHQEISGVSRTHFCGAYWRNGFHEDGLWSGVRVARALGVDVARRLGMSES